MEPMDKSCERNDDDAVEQKGEQIEDSSLALVREAWLAQALKAQSYKCVNGLSICILPAGWITDYILAAVSLSLCLALVLMRPHAPVAHDVDTIAVWHIGFLGASFVSSLMGGIIHHYCYMLVRSIERGMSPHPPGVEETINHAWRVILAVGSVPNFCLFASGTWILFKTHEAASLATYVGAGLYFAVAAVVGLTKKIKIHVVASLPTMLFFCGCNIYRISKVAARWNLAAGVGLLISGLVVALKLSPGRSFNHNALLHVTLCLVCICMFIGALIGL
eukprot:TRINITY_DN5297_c0_g3_i2.p1 TRINITY_DN5297_c0_g3~~TRINITY_DN5297_c0_g3_i2.p1  ORF type:complete len:277 (+),score=38.50 TRINITY_DN5297_c0_g3_i2:53-883(+)